MSVIGVFQTAVEYTNTFYSKALQNVPKLGFFGLKINHLATLVHINQTGFHVDSKIDVTIY
jgi:hypothetical protein